MPPHDPKALFKLLHEAPLEAPPQTLVETPPLYYLPGLISESDASDLQDRLRQELDWQQPELTLYGRSHPIPRQQVWMGDHAYRYSGRDFAPCPWHPSVAALRDRLNDLLERFSAVDKSTPTSAFNSVLINRYRNGEDRMGWHCDNEAELGDCPTIASISLGATRPMRFRWKDRSSEAFNVWLESGSLLWMGPGCQEQLEHALLPRKIPGERINLTFRRLIA